VSAATIWELAIKTGLGKLTLSMPYRQWMEGAIVDLNAAVLPITVQYADVQATLPRIHGDPFDRMLVAQSQAEQIALVSNEILLDQYGIVRIW
jgi:PIN domain nuclease of toxin-antitoxin system